MSSLSASDRKVVCGGFIAQLDEKLTRSEYERLTCTKQALPLSFQTDPEGIVGGSVELCGRFVDDCVKNGGAIGDGTPAPTLGEDLVDADGCEAQIRACDLTVSAFERCTESFAAEVQSLLTLSSCDAVNSLATLEKLSSGVDPAGLPDCEAFTVTCSGITLDANADGLK